MIRYENVLWYSLFYYLYLCFIIQMIRIIYPEINFLYIDLEDNINLRILCLR